MKKNIIIFMFLTLLSRLILSLSGMVATPLGDVIYVAAFAISVIIGTAIAQKDKLRREEEAGVCEAPDRLLSLRGTDLPLLLPIVFPTVATVFLTAYLTYLVLSCFGAAVTPSVSGSLFELILTGAFVPAVLEEMLFRYLPMKLLLPYGRKWTVILSAVSFSVFHLNVEQYAYALVAGLIFIAVDIAFDSVLPSMILHFMNNLLSVVWVKLGGDEVYSAVFAVSLTFLALVSAVFIAVFRRKYAGLLKRPVAKEKNNG